jgi:hypothetical protein
MPGVLPTGAPFGATMRRRRSSRRSGRGEAWGGGSRGQPCLVHRPQEALGAPLLLLMV